jgi:signal transduction histidine kinase
MSVPGRPARFDGRGIGGIFWNVKQAHAPKPAVPDATVVAGRVEELAVVGRLASRLSGEMRQPLSVMRNAVYFLNLHSGTSLDEQARRHLTFMLRAVEDVNSIASNLATLAGTEVADRQVTDVEVLVSAALGRVQTRPDVVIETALDPGAALFGDPSQIQRALVNIINNSIQALPGEVRIRIVCRHEGRETRIVISDNGPGMSEEVRSRVFEPFFTTSSHRVGIGMTVAQRLVGACGGTTVVESTPGSGTTVTLSVPRHEVP